MTHHLFVDLSAHGLGHLAQTAPVLNALRARLPALQLTIRCGLARERLALRIQGEFEHIPSASDFGLTMKSALDVDRAASLARYRAFHAAWDRQVNDYAQLLVQQQPDWVLANISYLALAAAERARIKATALCSLNWAEIFYPYCAEAPDAGPMREQMLAAYNSAEAFLRITPGMVMHGLHNIIPLGPIARQGQNLRAELHRALGLHTNARLVLVAMGGIGLRLSPITWPSHPDVFWLVPQNAGLQRMDVISLENIDMDFSDLIASCDCVMTKSGYGTFVEAATAGTPVLYVERPDWPEEPCLVEWLHQHNHAIGISREQFEHGDFGESIWDLACGARSVPIVPTGIEQAAEHLLARLQPTRSTD
ncbi:MAG: hypothetical protein IV108_07665 [Burkholderiales bacterium]|nr:hypothetical protein [Burkholderiales bacterium]